MSRKVFDLYGIPLHSVDLDAPAWAQRGGRLREVLHSRTGVNTLPQIFVGGEFVGGCTEVFDGLKSRRLAPRLERAGVPLDGGADHDPHSHLPRWVQPR